MLNPYENVLKRIVSIRKYVTDYETGNRIQPGDIIGINRGLYEHYGIYVGGNKVIHYTSLSSDTSSDNVIMETGMHLFMRGQTDLFILDVERLISEKKLLQQLIASQGTDYRLYTAEETVQRAKNEEGQRKYSLLNNNCEHFAMWCKTGVSEMNQLFYGTEQFKKYLTYAEHIRTIIREFDEVIRQNEEEIAQDDREIELHVRNIAALAEQSEELICQLQELERRVVSASDAALNARVDRVLDKYNL
jgi:hypothetical protein